jgi:hypothetical protein
MEPKRLFYLVEYGENIRYNYLPISLFYAILNSQAGWNTEQKSLPDIRLTPQGWLHFRTSSAI